MRVKAELRGFRELEAQLKNVGDEVAQVKVLGSALRSAMRPVLAAAKAFVPVDTGFLREAIRLRVFKPRGSLPTAAAVGVFWSSRARGLAKYLQPFYVQFVERGTRRAPAKPFLRPAFDQSEGKMLLILREALGKAIDRAVKRRVVSGR